jgi:hypothetical protein
MSLGRAVLMADERRFKHLYHYRRRDAVGIPGTITSGYTTLSVWADSLPSRSVLRTSTRLHHAHCNCAVFCIIKQIGITSCSVAPATTLDFFPIILMHYANALVVLVLPTRNAQSRTFSTP